MAAPTVTPTEGRSLLGAGLAGGVGAWALVRGIQWATGGPPQLSWTVVALLGLLAAVVLALAWTVRRDNRPGEPHPEPRLSVARLALGKAALIGGVTLAVGYAVFALMFVGHLDVPAPRARVVRGVAAAILSAVVAVAGWLLERGCRGRWDDPTETGREDR